MTPGREESSSDQHALGVEAALQVAHGRVGAGPVADAETLRLADPPACPLDVDDSFPAVGLAGTTHVLGVVEGDDTTLLVGGGEAVGCGHRRIKARSIGISKDQPAVTPPARQTTAPPSASGT